MIARRRRVLRILACGLGAGGVMVAPGNTARGPVLTWRGVALGAEAEVRLRHADSARAERTMGSVLAEIDRLEGEFSLHRANSAICRLNRDRRLAWPSLDMRRVLERAMHYGEITGGAFDVTIQPLWQAVSDAVRDGAEPAPRLLDAARALVNFRDIEIGAAEIRLARPGMAVTLNAIAQGYVTDRVAGLLADGGFADTLVDVGELRAGAAPWRIGLAHPGRGEAQAMLQDCGVATSAGAGSAFTSDGRWHHIIDPRSATCPPAGRAASVIATGATDADALATALTLLPPSAAPGLLRQAAARALLSEPGQAQRWLA